MASLPPSSMFAMHDYSFVHFSEDEAVNDSVTSNPPQPRMPTLPAALTSQVSQTPGLGCSPPALCHRAALFQKTKVCFMGEQHSKPEISASNKEIPLVPTRKQRRGFARSITGVLRWSVVFSQVVSNCERGKGRAPLFLLRKKQIQRFLRASVQSCCDSGCRTETFIEKKVIAETVLLHKIKAQFCFPHVQPCSGMLMDVRRMRGGTHTMSPSSWGHLRRRYLENGSRSYMYRSCSYTFFSHPCGASSKILPLMAPHQPCIVVGPH